MKKPHALIGLLAALGTTIGVLVAVFGLPYGRMNYTAFAGLYHNPVGSGTPAIAGHMAIDCDTSTAGVQDNCSYPATGAAIPLAVTFADNSAAGSIGAFAFSIRNPDLTRLSVVAVPTLNAGGAGALGTWDCAFIPPNLDEDANPAVTATSIDCFTNPGPGPATVAGVNTVLGNLSYNRLGVAGSVTLSFARGLTGDNDGVELVGCNGVDGLPGPGDGDMDTIDDSVDNGQCFPAIINLTPPPTATETSVPPTATNTPIPPTATNTPAGGTITKRPETCFPYPSVGSANCDPAIPASNLFLCVNPAPCSGPGEGNLIVYEYATNITTGDQDSNTTQDGLGAYEFSVEYDNFVIQSINASDVVFAATGSVLPYPNGSDGVVDGEGAARGPATCNFSLVFENVVNFGCVTTGPTPDGPLGDMDLAQLNLIPHPDLTNDIFPGNDNGVVTVLKDNGCELVDVFGHPTLGSVGGGLTQVCGDLAVTVRILEGDLNLDCTVDVADQQLIAFRYGSFFGSLLYGQWYDLEPNLHDLDIDIKDLQKVFGRDGSTCQNPIPVQPPAPPPAPFGN